MKTVFTINLLDCKDESVACIHALEQVMEKFRYTMGSNDLSAVRAWFIEKYGTDTRSVKPHGMEGWTYPQDIVTKIHDDCG